MDISLCSPQPIYIIVEQIYSKSGLPSIANTIGPSLQQVFRRVIQVCGVQETYFGGQRVIGLPSAWQTIQELIMPGTQITTKPTGEKRLMLVYAGFRNIVQALPWTDSHELGGPPLSAYVYGSDPLPAVQLYGNPRVDFVVPGGKGAPMALATYDPKRGLVEVPSVSERDMVIRSLLQSRLIE